ncbi:MAG: TetR/AcrR family transcriptional regulator [Muribaculaceae bacterium]|nr:TetR/AcrR family transcriptional regulator [Muribaculaceae bacterium]
MEVKEHIIQEAGKLLQRIGPTSMTMDAVARSCGISKRTLYEKFPDKLTLIKECIETETHERNERVKQIFEQSENCFAALFNVFAHVREYMQKTSNAYIDDIKRLYPELFAMRRERERNFVMQLSGVLKQAQTEGHVLPGINTDVAAFLFLSTIDNLHNHDHIDSFGFNKIEAFDGAFLNFLRGIATKAGRDIIDSHIHEIKN